MPTYAVEDSFWSDWRRLSSRQREAFLNELAAFVDVLKQNEDAGFPSIPVFPKRLGVTPMVGKRKVMEFAWAPDGRATWQYGPRQKPGKYHVVWRHVGSHEIYEEEKGTRD